MVRAGRFTKPETVDPGLGGVAADGPEDVFVAAGRDGGRALGGGAHLCLGARPGCVGGGDPDAGGRDDSGRMVGGGEKAAGKGGMAVMPGRTGDRLPGNRAGGGGAAQPRRGG